MSDINLLFSILSTLDIITRFPLHQDLIYWVFTQFFACRQTPKNSKKCGFQKKFCSYAVLQTNPMWMHWIAAANLGTRAHGIVDKNDLPTSHSDHKMAYQQLRQGKPNGEYYLTPTGLMIIMEGDQQNFAIAKSLW